VKILRLGWFSAGANTHAIREGKVKEISRYALADYVAPQAKP